MEHIKNYNAGNTFNKRFLLGFNKKVSKWVILSQLRKSSSRSKKDYLSKEEVLIVLILKIRYFTKEKKKL